MSRFDAPLEPAKSNLAKAHLGALSTAVKERLAARGLEGTIRLSFDSPPAPGAELVTRNHPLAATLAEALFEGTLDPGSAPTAPTSSLGRAGAWPTSGVKSVTTILLLRLRFKLTVHGRHERLLLVEEAGAMAFDVSSSEASATGEVALALLDRPSSGDLARIARRRIQTQARDRATNTFRGAIAAHARRRAAELAKDDARVRAAGIEVSRVSAEPVLPPDIIGLYVLLPQGA